MKAFFVWFAGFFEDQAGIASSKRVTMYWLMGIFTVICIHSLRPGVVVDTNVLWTLAGMILMFGGYVTSEFFKSKPFGSDSSSSQTETKPIIKTDSQNEVH